MELTVYNQSKFKAKKSNIWQKFFPDNITLYFYKFECH